MAFLQHPSPSFTSTRLPSFSVPIRASSRLSLPTTPTFNSTSFSKWVPDFRAKSLNWVFSGALALSLSLTGKSRVGFAEAKVGVNKPELLPKEFTPVIDVAGFLSDGQEKRIAQEISSIEEDTGFKLRVLAQNYPDTPGLAIKDFWQVDDRTIVFVADPTFGNILNFNVGATVDLDIPRSFWSRLAGKYGNMFYWKEEVEAYFFLMPKKTKEEAYFFLAQTTGEDASIEAAVMAISNCLKEPVGPNNCSEVK
ncbi:hypothetical protein COLO4_26969 [Corchorus olitorius]|uniref:TPM domain-containing protein n=1 Tax=Corchorus olitorius TaxID=93759 RepID=A0A1R3HTB1_9ROSI|nr:hypothetical protein COLO4_26969 [Corchorus olitorius]